MPVIFHEDAPSIKRIWLYTYQYVNTRFEYRDRDLLKRIQINKVKTYTKDRLNQPSERYEIITSSYPQYNEYLKIKGKLSKRQRKIKHQYQITLQLENLTWDSRFRLHVGSFKKWPDNKKIKWEDIKPLHKSLKERYEKKYGKGTKEYKQAVEKHKKRAKYISAGDYISRVYGLNGDWYFRGKPLAKKYHCSFGITWNTELPEDIPYMFFGKHELRLFEVLLKRKIIKKT